MRARSWSFVGVLLGLAGCGGSGNASTDPDPHDEQSADADLPDADADSPASGDAQAADAGKQDAAQEQTDAALGPPVTYFRDIEPIVKTHCLGCHIVGGRGPFPLTSFDEVFRKGREMAAATAARIMPLCDGAAPETCGLSTQQIDTIQAWVAQGRPEGTRP